MIPYNHGGQFFREPSIGFLSVVDGLVLGDDPAGGLFDGSSFIHPEMRFSLRFPEGLTELAGRGQWRRPDGVVSREPSRVLLIWYSPVKDKNADIEAIRTAYKARFKQLSVMRVDGVDCVSF